MIWMRLNDLYDVRCFSVTEPNGGEGVGGEGQVIEHTCNDNCVRILHYGNIVEKLKSRRLNICFLWFAHKKNIASPLILILIQYQT